MTEEGKYSLDAVQNNPDVEGSLRNEVNKVQEQADDLSKMIQASGIITGNDDWNNYMTTGIYKVQGTSMTAEYHAPVGMYAWGTLVISVASTGNGSRALQIYYPHMILGQGQPIAMATRTHEGSSGWQPWYAVSGTLLG